MKQVLQHLRTGQIELADVPCPAIRPGHLLIQTSCSLISAGTERMLVEFSRGGLIAKARAQPDKVRQVLDKIKTDGLLPTLEAVFSKLDEPMPLGYCNVGRVVEVGRDVHHFKIGDRVASNGPHAEMVCVPSNLAARVPDSIDDESASFTVLGSIALHGIRLLQPTLGEDVVVYGLGLVGLIAAQLLRAHGCNVLGVDINPARCALARTFGCEAVAVAEGVDPVKAAEGFSHGRGVDGVLITASAKTDEIVHQAAQMCRKRGRIVLVGVVGLDLRRADFYEKEISFQVSCSYGPGRYDPEYEEQNRDYPIGYVRWTEARNFQAMLGALAAGTVDFHPLISRRIPQADAAQAYDAILNDGSVLGVIMTYPDQPAPVQRSLQLKSSAARSAPSRPVVGLIGSGNFARQCLLPALKACGANIKSVASASGVSSRHAGKRFEIEQVTTDYREILQSREINTVFITTRHNSHPKMVVEALEAGKHVFVEKPLAIDEAGLEWVERACAAHPGQQLMVGFNRRFAPHAIAAKKLLAGRSHPITVNIMVNGGHIPANHWLHDPNVGGGRIIGEGCHFIDLGMFLVGSPIKTVQAAFILPNRDRELWETMTLMLTCDDGSLVVVNYWANGAKSYPKERIEIFSEGRILVIDNFRRMEAYDWPGAARMKMSQDKGHKNEIAGFLDRVAHGGEPLIPFEQLAQVTRVSFAAIRSAKEKIVVDLPGTIASASAQLNHLPIGGTV
jgi:predicted dehydrogenase/threonine dehydrogenase-like Zn-dependent dehydrogenase